MERSPPRTSDYLPRARLPPHHRAPYGHTPRHSTARYQALDVNNPPTPSLAPTQLQLQPQPIFSAPVQPNPRLKAKMTPTTPADRAQTTPQSESPCFSSQTQTHTQTSRRSDDLRPADTRAVSRALHRRGPGWGGVGRRCPTGCLRGVLAGAFEGPRGATGDLRRSAVAHGARRGTSTRRRATPARCRGRCPLAAAGEMDQSFAVCARWRNGLHNRRARDAWLRGGERLAGGLRFVLTTITSHSFSHFHFHSIPCLPARFRV